MKNKSTRISVFLDNAMLHSLRSTARREDRSQSKVIRRALEAYLGVDDHVTRGGAREKSPELEA